MPMKRLIVAGNGMVGQRLVDALRERDEAGAWQVTVLSEGIVLVSGTPADVAADAAVRAVYLG